MSKEHFDWYFFGVLLLIVTVRLVGDLWLIHLDSKHRSELEAMFGTRKDTP